MAIIVVDWSPDWPTQFELVAAVLRSALADIPSAAVEHVGSTSVPGLAAKPVIDIDVIVDRGSIPAAISALEEVGYRNRGDLGIANRTAMLAPDQNPARHVYVCVAGSLGVRNHLAVRDVLRRRPDLRDDYSAVKRALVLDGALSPDKYTAAKSDVLQRILAETDLSPLELAEIAEANRPR